MNIKKGLLSILFLILLGTVVYAGTDNMNEVYISKKFNLEYTVLGQSFFLFSNGNLDNCDGDICILFSDVTVSGQYTGLIKSFLSTLTLDKDSSFDGKISVFSSKTIVPMENSQSIEVIPFVGFLNFHMKQFVERDYVIYDDTIPNIVFQVCLSLIIILFCFLFLPIKKSFFEQCGASLLYEPVGIIKNGLTFYFIAIALSVIFFLSVIGFPVTILIIVLTVIFSLLGEVALSIILGYVISDILHMENNTYSNALIGVIIIETIKLVPRFGWAMSFVVLPIFALGLLSTGFKNGFLKKVYYELPYNTFDSPKANKNIDLKKIILGEKDG